ncbi:MAG: hypothetical protein H7306_09110, partial [Bacteriovorax sp.]|nr:hypothetical protein [Rhizobacter sp.]
MTRAMNLRSAARWAHGKPWLGSCVAAVLAWAATVFSGHGQGASLTAIAPMSAPPGDTTRPRNCPPPRITAAIETSVYIAAILAS